MQFPDKTVLVDFDKSEKENKKQVKNNRELDERFQEEA